jgi:arylsulfatase A-like enzyme
VQIPDGEPGAAVSRREFVKLAATATAVAAVPRGLRGGEESPRMPPNILFLYTDEQRSDSLACYGNRRGIMPHVDRLAGQATVFERAYCTQPVCTPGRGSLFTGLYSHAHGAVENNLAMRRDAKCLPEFLPAGVYAAGHFGKWHLGDEIFPQHGFTDWRGTEDTYHMAYSPPVKEFGPERSHYHHWLMKHGVQPLTPANLKPGDPKWHPAYENRFFRDQIHALPEDLSRPAFLAEQAVEFIQTHRARPWVLAVNFLEPHPPYHSCRDRQYQPGEVDLSPNWRETLGTDRPLRLRMRAHAEREDEVALRDVTARYWGMCSLVDAHVGRILKALEDDGLLDRTIVVYTTDHGDMLGGYGLGGKSCMFEESAGVPLIVRLPGQRRQRRVAAPVSHVDVTPTLLDLVGQSVPGHLHGESLRPVLEGKRSDTGRDVFIQWETGPVRPPKPAKVRPGMERLGSPEQMAAANHERIRTVVTRDGWKFNRNSMGLNELYDLNADPLERRNLASDPAQAARAADLEQRIAAWQKRVDDPG